MPAKSKSNYGNPVSKKLDKDNKSIQNYIKNRIKEHCEIIGPHCDQCSVSGYCEHRKKR